MCVIFIVSGRRPILSQIGWNTKISARATNYGTRIDFILITPGLVPWVKAADIQPSLKGSDHCPVYIDLRDEIISADGSKVKLVDVIGAKLIAGESPEPPRLAAKYWDEHKQKLLSTFFGKKFEDVHPEKSRSATPSQSSAIDDTVEHVLNSLTSPPSATHVVSGAIPDQSVRATKRRLVPEDTRSAKKSKLAESHKSSGGKTKHSVQATLVGFFSQPKASSSKTKAKSRSGSEHANSDGVVDEDADYRFALHLSQLEENIGPLPNSQGSANGTSKEKWSSLLAPTKPPNCSAHNEPAKEFTVNKPGPNKGKRFFVCARCVTLYLSIADAEGNSPARPVGPGYDKGRAERLRQHVDPQFKCDFFMWASDARKDMVKDKEAL